MDDLIKNIQERTGLPADTVLEVVTMVTDYLRNALPDDLVRQVTSYLNRAAESAGAARTSATAGASNAVGRATDVAASAFNAARESMTNTSGPANDR